MRMTDQTLTDHYALYHGDSCELLPSLPDASIHFSVYSPPFAGLYHYSSSERDLSNCKSRDEFLRHYEFIVEQIARLTMPGRLTAVHCMDVPKGGGTLYDFPGDIIRMHERVDMEFVARHWIWKEPLSVRLRTMARGLAHKQVVVDSTGCDVAGADYLLMFRKKGQNPIPVTHPIGLMHYAGEREIPADVLRFRGFEGPQRENRFSHWIWRQYASSVWDDVRVGHVVPYEEGRESDDEKHVHPLQLDVIERALVLRSNPGETVLTPFMGVGSEVYGAVLNGRRGVGIELKASYYRQAIKNVAAGLHARDAEQAPLFAGGEASA